MFEWITRYMQGQNDPVYTYAMQLDSADRKIIMDCQRLYNGNFLQMLGELALVTQHASQANQGLAELVDKMSRAEALHKFEQKNNIRLFKYLSKYDHKFNNAYDKTVKGITRAASVL